MLFWGTESAIQSHSGLGECSSEGDGVKSLRADGESLEQVRCFPRIVGDGGHAATQLSQELTACAVDGTQRFDSHRAEIVSGKYSNLPARKVGVFGSFSVRQRSLLRLQALLTSGGYRRSRTCERLLRPKQHTCPSPKEREWLRPVFCRRFGSGLVVPSSLGRPLSPGLSRLYRSRRSGGPAALPVDRLQTSPWWPPESAVSPQWHWCGAQSSSPSRSPTATRTASMLGPNPHEATGIVRSQSPECGDDTAPSLAWLSGSLLDDHTAALNFDGYERSVPDLLAGQELFVSRRLR